MTHFSISIQQKLSRNITFADDIQYIHSQFLAWKNAGTTTFETNFWREKAKHKFGDPVHKLAQIKH